MSGENLYEILGLDKNASEKEIKTAFKKLALKYHPDKCKTPDEKESNEAEFKKISAAYDTLSNPEKRSQYDMGGVGSVGCGNANQFFNFFNVVNQSSNVMVTVQLTLEEVYTGIIKTIKYNKNVFCDTCCGKGHSNLPDSVATCQHCNGSGYFEQVLNMGFMTQVIKSHCPHCHGRGIFIIKVCETCRGNLYVSKDVSVKLKFAKGTLDGESVVLKQRGNTVGHNMHTDLIVTTQIKPHPVFTRVNQSDLLMTMDISLVEALCGFEKQFKHLDDEELTVKSESIVNPNSKLTMHNKGIKNGSLVIKFNIKFPTELTTFMKDITTLNKDTL